MNKVTTIFGILCIFFLAGCILNAGGPRGNSATTTQDSNTTRLASDPIRQDGIQDNAQDTTSQQSGYHPAMLNPNLADKTAPDIYRVKFVTTKGDFILEVNREWAPNGADRFFNLVDIGYFKDIAIFRAVNGFMFQFGIHGDPAISRIWKDANIRDDAAKGISNLPGYISFANAGPHTRSNQLFINLGNNARLDSMGFTPFGKVVEGMEVIKKINTQYGENASQVQPNFQSKGNKYILDSFPNLDIIKSVELVVADED